MNDVLLNKIKVIIQNHLEDEDFGVTELASEIGLSTSQLLRRVKASTDNTVSEFIRNIRLQEAAKLILESDYTASEISYMVGFSSPSYFSKCFNDYFGVTPGEYKLKSETTSELKEDLKASDNIPDPSSERKPLKIMTFIVIFSFIGLLIFGSLWIWPKTESNNNPSIRSLIVLPFSNFTGNDDYEYFVAGIHASLIHDIGKISALNVKSMTTANSFKGTDMSVPEIATKLGIDAAVEGSVTCMDNDSVCIRIRLIRAYPEEQQVWVQDYTVEKSQILNFYNKVTKQISKEIDIVLTPQEETHLAESRTVDPEAYDAYLMGRFYWNRLSKEGFEMATDYFEIAVKKDPDWAPPYAGLAEVWAGKMQMNFTSSSIAIPKIYKNMNKALELNPNSANSHYVNAILAVWAEWNWEKGEKEFLKTLELNPNHAMCRIYYAHFLMIMLRKEEALNQANLALELDPMEPLLLGLYGAISSYYGDYEHSILLTKKALSIDPKNRFSKLRLAIAYGNIGEYKKWFEIGKEIPFWNENIITSIEKIFYEQGYNEQSYLTAIEEITKMNEEIIKRGGKISNRRQAHNYLKVKKLEKAMDYFEKVYENHNPNMPYVSLQSLQYDQLKDNPRYIELLRKLKLPMDDKQRVTINIQE